VPFPRLDVIDYLTKALLKSLLGVLWTYLERVSSLLKSKCGVFMGTRAKHHIMMSRLVLAVFLNCHTFLS
jgi:hypothetical protein